MSVPAPLQRILDFIETAHEANADGCKESCSERAVGYHYSKYGESYWYCLFGGYCLGDLSRQVTVKANTLVELEAEVRHTIDQALTKEYA